MLPAKGSSAPAALTGSEVMPKLQCSLPKVDGPFRCRASPVDPANFLMAAADMSKQGQLPDAAKGRSIPAGPTQRLQTGILEVAEQSSRS